MAHGQEWTAQIRGSSQVTVRIPSVRGEIKDRNGLTMVQNRASYEVDFYLPEMVKGYRERFGSPPTSEYRAIISGMPKNMKEPDIIKIVNDGIVPRLNDLDLVRAITTRASCRNIFVTIPRAFIFLHQGHRFPNHGEVRRARCRTSWC